MITIYELLEVEEDASKEEIELAYSKLVYEYRQDMKFDEKTNKENELILNRLKLAYEILTDDAKRKKYDYDLAQKRAESLLENVAQKQEENKVIENKDENVDFQSEEPTKGNYEEKNIQEKQVEQRYSSKVNNINNSQSYEEQEELTEEEKNKIRKAAKKEFNQKLKKVKQAEEEYNEAYNKAYRDYMRKMGYQVEEPWTLKRIMRVIVAIIIVILILIVLWLIPPVKQFFINIYEGNFIIKAIVDLIKAIGSAILGK